MTERDNGARLNKLTDSLCRSRMYDAANAHKQAVEEFESMPFKDLKRPHNPSHAYHDFLEGWRAAMTVEHSELLDENQELHNIVMDLCTRLMLRRCDKCKGNRVDDSLNDCSKCNGDGYVMLPDGDAEKIVDDVIRKAADR